MLIDSHAHLNFHVFLKDRSEVVRRCFDNDLKVINIGSCLETSRGAIELAEKYHQGFYASVGLHPIHAPGVSSLIKSKLDPEESAAQIKIEKFNIDEYHYLAQSSQKVVAIGEIGLDYYYRPKTKSKLTEFENIQKDILLQQINLAKELNLPIVFHCRSAHEDLIEILKLQSTNSKSQTNSKIQDLKIKTRGVIHCFTGTIQQAKEYLDLGLYLGFTGIIFREIQGINWLETIKALPLEKILVETDAPYLGPKNTRNEPLFVKEVIKEIARIKKLSYEEVAKTTTNNAKILFNI